MANTITMAQKFLPIIDGIYKASSVTAGMDAATDPGFSGVGEVKVMKISSTGLGDYDRNNGYPKGDVDLSWEVMKLTEERGKEFSIDRMDNEEALGKAFGTVTGEFMRLHVIPELDAYRFAKYASADGILTTAGAVLTKESIISAIDEAVKELNASEVPLEGRRLYINSNLQPLLNGALSRQWGSDTAVNTMLANYNGMPIVYVPPTRFYTGITMNDGTTEWGYKKSEGAKDINFMIVYPKAILQAVKLSLPKIFSPDVNQDKDAWKFQFRMYHDAIVYDNKAKGIYLHKGV